MHVVYIVLMLISFGLLYLFVIPYSSLSPATSYSFSALFLLSLLTFILASSLNPGYMTKSDKIDLQLLLEHFEPSSICPECSLLKSHRSKHCLICNRCVERFDHHCPWINNCIGVNNYFWFYFFIASMTTYLPFVVYICFSSYQTYI